MNEHQTTRKSVKVSKHNLDSRQTRRERTRVVERSDNKRHALGILANLGAQREGINTHGNTPRFGPFIEVFVCIKCFVNHPSELEEVGLERRATKVYAESFAETVEIVYAKYTHTLIFFSQEEDVEMRERTLDHVAHLKKLFLPVCERTRLSGVEAITKCLANLPSQSNMSLKYITTKTIANLLWEHHRQG